MTARRPIHPAWAWAAAVVLAVVVWFVMSTAMRGFGS